MDDNGKYKSIGKKISIKYKTLLDLWTDFYSVFCPLTSVVPIFINFLFGYYDGNYYSKLIESLFRYEESESKDIITLRRFKKKGVIRNNVDQFLVDNNQSNQIKDSRENQPFIEEPFEIYGKSKCCHYTYCVNKCGNCNSIRKRICNNILTGFISDIIKCKKKEDFSNEGCCDSYCNYILLRIIIFLEIISIIVLFIWLVQESIYVVGGFIGLIVFLVCLILCYCCYIKKNCCCSNCCNGETSLNFSYARDIVKKYIDITFIVQKLFELEQMKVKKKFEGISENAIIIEGLFPNKNKELYKEWIGDQRVQKI